MSFIEKWTTLIRFRKFSHFSAVAIPFCFILVQTWVITVQHFVFIITFGSLLDEKIKNIYLIA